MAHEVKVKIACQERLLSEAFQMSRLRFSARELVSGAGSAIGIPFPSPPGSTRDQRDSSSSYQTPYPSPRQRHLSSLACVCVCVRALIVRISAGTRDQAP